MFLDDIDLDTRTQEILLAATNHDLSALKPFLRVPGAASVQDPETGSTPLHATIAACGTATHSIADIINEPTGGDVNGTVNGNSDKVREGADEDEKVDIELAKATVKELFLSGAIWNDLDTNNETPGCLAWRLGQRELYELVVEAGVRAELLMNLMGGYERLPDEDEDEDEDEENMEEEEVPNAIIADPAEQPLSIDPATSKIPQPLQLDKDKENTVPQHFDVNSEAYLASTLTFTPFKLLDASTNGVMMAWETPIMELTTKLLAPIPGLRILNIGFGMGIIDRLLAETKPAAHHIIEAHPDVIKRLRSTAPSAVAERGSSSQEASAGGEATTTGEVVEDNFTFFGPKWERSGESQNVLHAGKWQDIVPELLEQGLVFDVIYFDTFGEDYSRLKEFFSEYVVALLAADGRFSFFNGLGADRRVCYDVYCRVVELDLCDAGMDVQWTEVDVDLAGEEGQGQWEGVKRRYWTLDKYRLPICTFLG